MTLSEAYSELLKGKKVTYPGLSGYVILKDGKLVTELDFESAHKRKDWSVKEEPWTKPEDKKVDVKTDKSKDEKSSKFKYYSMTTDDFNKIFDNIVNDFIKGFRF